MLKSRLKAASAMLALVVACTGHATAQTSETGNPVRPFWGDISPFYGDVSPFWGDISPFWGDIAPFWGDISPFMGELQAGGDAAALLPASGDIYARSRTFWSSTIEARTGLSFEEAFADALFDKYDLELDGGAIHGLDALSALDRSRFLFDWYDGLMSFSGRDHVDHWMATANWYPKLTQIQGAGAGVVIGLIDFTLTDDDMEDNLSPLVLWSGEQNAHEGHGGAVASLLVADHDGRGVMGIAPQATVPAFNPYDSSGTTNWNMVANGVTQLVFAGANVINLSLGVPGQIFDQGWRNVYNRLDVAAVKGRTIFVHAAGNDGVAGSGLVDMQVDLFNLPQIILVGSVGPSGQISAFSNTPGTACFSYFASKCTTDRLLMNRFVVAPGEWILVTDGEGGVTRRSGTSLAAPMVTGAIALMQTRWGWLKQQPAETADIIFRTAKDLGAPGVDPIYGRGLLDIEASQSPLPGAQLYQLVPDDKGVLQKVYLSSTALADPSSLWGAQTGVVEIFEDVGTTYRDFDIPLDAQLASTTSPTTSPLQTYLTDTANTLSTLATSGKSTTTRRKLFPDAAMANPMGLSVSAYVEPRDRSPGDEGPRFNSAVAIDGKAGRTLRLGYGLGAMALGGQPGVTEASYRPGTGGANPMLGLASGGAFSKAELKAGTATFHLGVTERSQEQVYIDPASGEERAIFEGLKPYRAAAAHMSVTQEVGERLALTAGYTFLKEEDGLLGVQALNPAWLSQGAQTDAATLAASLELSPRILLTGSATYGRTRDAALAQSLTVNEGGVHSTAFEAAVLFEGVFGRRDSARLALIQPMHIEAGSLDLTAGVVVDRDTGERALTTTQTSIADRARTLALDAAYTRPLLGGRASLAGFLRAEAAMAEGVRREPNHMAGTRLTLRF